MGIGVTGVILPAASPRHRNCFYYFRGPAARGAGAAEVDRQVEDNTTKALINLLEHSDRSVLASFDRRFIPLARRDRIDEAQFFLQGGPETVAADWRGLLAISVDGEIPHASWDGSVEAGSRIDASIYVHRSWLLVLEVKTAGTLKGDQLLRHCAEWAIERPRPDRSLPATWSLVKWRDVYHWADHERSSQHSEPTRFLLQQLVEYLQLAGLAPTSRFLPEHFAFFEQDPAERSPELTTEIKVRLETLWELVKDELGELRSEVEPTHVGTIRANKSNAWAQSNRGGRGVNLTIELNSREVQLNIVGGTAPQLSQLDRWLSSDARVDAARRSLRGYQLVVCRRDPVAHRSDGTPVWQGARWSDVRRWPIDAAADSEGRRRIAEERSRIAASGAKPAIHIRRTWTRQEVLAQGNALIPDLAEQIERLVPVVQHIRGSRRP